MLAYLFIVHFTDGTTFEQHPEDVSSRDHQRSSFYDLQRELDDGKQLQSFTLFNEDHTYAVDLLDGHFEIDRLPFWATPKDLPTVPESFKLVYYRRHTHDFQGGAEIDHSGRYVLGWECVVGGKNYQQTIGVD